MLRMLASNEHVLAHIGTCETSGLAVDTTCGRLKDVARLTVVSTLDNGADETTNVPYFKGQAGPLVVGLPLFCCHAKALGRRDGIQAAQSGRRNFGSLEVALHRIAVASTKKDKRGDITCINYENGPFWPRSAYHWRLVAIRHSNRRSWGRGPVLRRPPLSRQTQQPAHCLVPSPMLPIAENTRRAVNGVTQAALPTAAIYQNHYITKETITAKSRDGFLFAKFAASLTGIAALKPEENIHV